MSPPGWEDWITLKVPDNVSSNNSQSSQWQNLIFPVMVFYLVEESLGFSRRQQPEPRCGSEQHRCPLPLQTGDGILGHPQHRPHRLCSLWKHTTAVTMKERQAGRIIHTQTKVQHEDWTIETSVLVWGTSLCTCRCVCAHWILDQQADLHLYI